MILKKEPFAQGPQGVAEEAMFERLSRMNFNQHFRSQNQLSDWRFEVRKFTL